MKPEAMLAKCRREQWRADDLDWRATPRALDRADEIAIVQYFTDMAGIERLAGALFAEQRRRVHDPVLKKIFATFVVDEERHAEVAERLARFYDVHRYRAYHTNEHLERFRPHFVRAIRFLSPEIANAYITTGELVLDIALLRSIDDFVRDEMSHRAMELINRDESRHIAVDFHMVGYYASPAYRAALAAEARPLAERARGTLALGRMMFHAAPFFRDVFFKPMDLCDPSGKRMREAFKRVQLLASKPGVAERPFTRFMRSLQLVFNHPLAGPVLGKAVARVVGVDPRVLVELASDEEKARVATLSFDALADEALAAKYEG
ncbi:MAG: hypothetical protein HY908_18655 [Myxococcales bacterium]|nr:hypothetical protein [Myxococcales bacterium]